MAQVPISFEMDSDLKDSMEEICEGLGFSTTTAFIMFAKKLTDEKKFPFEIAEDPFFSETNINRLKKSIAAVKSGKSVLTEHELIEV